MVRWTVVPSLPGFKSWCSHLSWIYFRIFEQTFTKLIDACKLIKIKKEERGMKMKKKTRKEMKKEKKERKKMKKPMGNNP